MNPTSPLLLRLSSMLVALLLALQCVWIWAAELTRPGIARMPTDATSADIAAKGRDNAIWAARIGGIRGDLWEESAFTFANLLFVDLAAAPMPPASDARISIERAIGFAPHLSTAWLLLAGLPSAGNDIDRIEALKMSYYTGPSDLALMPLRLQMAIRAEALGDADVQQFVNRDLRLLIMRSQQAAIAEAYRQATPGSRRYLEQALGEIDPVYLKSLRAEAQKP